MTITQKTISTFLISLYHLLIVLFVLDAFTSFDIKNQFIQSFLYYGVFILSPIVLFWNLYRQAAAFEKVTGIVLPVFCTALFLIAGPTKILFSSSAWKTQTVLYEHGHLNFKKIEFQMQDKGGLGYNKRTVEVTYITQRFMITSPVPADIDQHGEWIKVNKDVNELKLT